MGISSAIGTIAIAKQTAKGVAAASPAIRYALAAPPSVMPIRNFARYTMTDAGRDEGDAYITDLGITGDFQTYLHFDGMALLAFLALGANADSGAGPDWTHTATPADTLPYFTLWRMVGNVIFEKYTDCKMNSLAFSSNAGGPVMVTLNVEGIDSTFLASDPVLARLTSAGLLHYEAKGAFKFSTVAQKLHAYNFEINNNLSPYQADDVEREEIDEGKRNVSLGFGVRFRGATAFPDYRKWLYGSDVGTALSPTVGTDAVDVTFTRAANKSVQILTPQVKYASMPINADPAGDPIAVEVATEVEKPAGGSICTIITKDQTATV